MFILDSTTPSLGIYSRSIVLSVDKGQAQARAQAQADMQLKKIHVHPPYTESSSYFDLSPC